MQQIGVYSNHLRAQPRCPLYLDELTSSGRPGMYVCGADFVVTHPLRDALNRIWRRPGDQFGEPSQVLGDGGQNKLILGASRAGQSKPVKPQDALEVCKPHLDLLALTSRLLESLGANERPGNVAGALVAWNLA